MVCPGIDYFVLQGLHQHILPLAHPYGPHLQVVLCATLLDAISTKVLYMA